HDALPIFLGDLPFIGAAFSSKEFNEVETELIVLVTPHLVDAMACDQAPKMLPGLETRSPDDFELFLEGILEAPRGPRDVCQNGRYVPAFKNGPTTALFPCGAERAGNPAGGVGCGSSIASPEPCSPQTRDNSPPVDLPVCSNGPGKDCSISASGTACLPAGSQA